MPEWLQALILVGVMAIALVTVLWKVIVWLSWPPSLLTRMGETDEKQIRELVRARKREAAEAAEGSE